MLNTTCTILTQNSVQEKTVYYICEKVRQCLTRDTMQAWPKPLCGVCLSICHVRGFCLNE